MTEISPWVTLVRAARNDSSLAGVLSDRIAARHRYGQDQGGVQGDWDQEDQSLIFVPIGGTPDLYDQVGRQRFQARCYGNTPEAADQVYQALVTFCRVNQRREVTFDASTKALVYYVVRESEPTLIMDEQVKPNGGMPCLLVNIRAEISECNIG